MSEAEEASQPVSDEELDRAADEAVGVAEEATEEEVIEEESSEEEEAEEEQEEEIPAEPDAEKENAERSKLGRKVKELEAQLERQSIENNERLAKALEAINNLTAKEEPEEDDFIMPETKSELQKLIDEALEKKEQASKTVAVQKAEQYTKDYVDTMKDLVADEEDDVREEIIARLKTEEFNVRHSDNGSRDAAKNIKNVIKSLAVKKNVIPLKGEKPRAPLGGGGKDKVPGRELKLPKLSQEARDFIKATGMSDEEAAEALSGEAPAYIRA